MIYSDVIFVRNGKIWSRLEFSLYDFWYVMSGRKLELAEENNASIARPFGLSSIEWVV